jgi:hypothetical protein
MNEKKSRSQICEKGSKRVHVTTALCAAEIAVEFSHSQTAQSKVLQR